MKIILYSDDINLLMHWEKALNDKEYKIIEDISDFEHTSNSLIIINYTACKKECETLLSALSKQNNKVLVLDRVPDIQKAKTLLHSGAMGYGNAMMRKHFILSALDALEENMVWLYPELTSALILELPSTKAEKEHQLLQNLTQREKEVASLLKDGLTYNAIAEKLNITARTVKAHAQAIYLKLNVKDRLGLALLLK